MKLINENVSNNDTDDLYKVWRPYIGERVITKEEMIEELQDAIAVIKLGGLPQLGRGLAFRCIQVMQRDEPYISTESDDEFFKNLKYRD